MKLKGPRTNNLFKIVTALFENIIADLERWDRRKFVKEVFTQNLRTKSVALIFTLFFFYYVNLQNIQQKTLFIPLKIKKPEELALVTEIPESITLSISGRRDDLINLDNNNIFAEISIATNELEGEVTSFPIVKGIPDEIQILGISPDKVDLTFSSLHSKIIRVLPEFVGQLSRSFILDQYTIVPKRLKVSAPLDILEDLTSLKTEPIDIGDLKASKEFEVELNKNIHPNIVVDKSKKFTVSLFIKNRIETRTVVGKFPVEIEFLPDTLVTNEDYFLNRVSYKLKNGVRGEFDFSSEERFFYLDGSAIEEAGTYLLEVKFDNSIKDLEITRVEPSSINVVVEPEIVF